MWEGEGNRKRGEREKRRENIKHEENEREKMMSERGEERNKKVQEERKGKVTG